MHRRNNWVNIGIDSTKSAACWFVTLLPDWLTGSKSDYGLWH